MLCTFRGSGLETRSSHWNYPALGLPLALAKESGALGGPEQAYNVGARDLSPGWNELIPGVRVRRGENRELRLEQVAIKWSRRGGGASKRGR